MKPLILILILFIISTPVYADKGKGIFTHMYLDEDLDVFTSNVSETPGHIYDNQSAVESDILNVQDWMNIGKTQLKSENWKPAEEVFSQVIKQEPKNTEGWEGYLLAIRGEENFEKLLEASEQATKENPDFASAWKYNGIALSSLSQSEEALKAFDTALSVDPSYYTVLYYKGIALDSLNRFDESVKAYEEVLSFNGNYTKAWNNKGVALSQIGRYDEALVAFDKALEIEPGYQMATKNKERVLQVQKGSYITNADVIDDSAEFNPIGIGDNSGGTPSVITMSPTSVPVTPSPAPISQTESSTAQNSPDPVVTESLQADFSVDSKDGYVPLPVQFTDQSSGSPNKWLWRFGDGTSSILQNPTYEYMVPGIYSVTLTVSDVSGTSSTESKENYINVTEPVSQEYEMSTEQTQNTNDLVSKDSRSVKLRGVDNTGWVIDIITSPEKYNFDVSDQSDEGYTTITGEGPTFQRPLELNLPKKIYLMGTASDGHGYFSIPEGVEAPKYDVTLYFSGVKVVHSTGQNWGYFGTRLEEISYHGKCPGQDCEFEFVPDYVPND